VSSARPLLCPAACGWSARCPAGPGTRARPRSRSQVHRLTNQGILDLSAKGPSRAGPPLRRWIQRHWPLCTDTWVLVEVRRDRALFLFAGQDALQPMTRAEAVDLAYWHISLGATNGAKAQCWGSLRDLLEHGYYDRVDARRQPRAEELQKALHAVYNLPTSTEESTRIPFILANGRLVYPDLDPDKPTGFTSLENGKR
jgi:hypothetical protein